MQLNNVESYLAVGCGRGIADIGLALEFPDIHFHLTDFESPRTPNYSQAQKVVSAWSLSNVSFGVCDILKKIPSDFDVISSVEVLEHVHEDRQAAINMLEAAEKAVFAVVPYASKQDQSNTRKQERAWQHHEHYRVGYDEQDLKVLFGHVDMVRGAYWSDAGLLLRESLNQLSDVEIQDSRSALVATASLDVRTSIPDSIDEAQGIWAITVK